MSADRDFVYESRQPKFNPNPPVEISRVVLAKDIAQSAQLLRDELIAVGFSPDVAVMICCQMLPKLL